MQPTYTIVGGDGQQYGPRSLAEVQDWINDGRVVSESQIHRSDLTEWRPAADYPEFKWDAVAEEAPAAPTTEQITPAPAPAAPTAAAPAEPAMLPPAVSASLLKSTRGGADWFFWVAGLTIINSAVTLSGSDWGFALGLGLGQVFDAFARQGGDTGFIIGIVLNVILVGVFILFGAFARRRHQWAFIVGMIAYALDAALVGLAQAWVGLGIHVFALWCMFQGFRASRELARLERGD
ncbi:MAG: DUF4339 domain-containing protein [Verrucomicrobia bacterium]|nr:DUF4339 domain-containing protein [Verrucomicrobiota bacterium]